MEFKEYIGKTVEDAVINAKQDLGLTSDEIEYEVVERGGKGFLGLGSKESVVRARKKDENSNSESTPTVNEESEPLENNDSQAQSNSLESSKTKEKKPIEEIDVTVHFDKIKTFIKDVASKMGEIVEVETKEGEDINSIDVNLSGDNMGIFIGKRGQTLDALQYLTSIIVNEDAKSYVRVKLDTEDYRNRRKATLENLASNMAKKATKLNRRVALEPMNPYERRIIHAYLQSDTKVDTYSEGVEPYRKVVIIPNK